MARLLVSVMDADEAMAAQSGGADIVDAKDPSTGALGALTGEDVRRIREALRPDTPLSVALGEATDVPTTHERAAVAATHGAHFVKLGFATVTDPGRVEAHLDAARAGANTRAAGPGIIAVAYADADRIGAASPEAILAVATSSAAHGILLDTARKDAPGLFELWDRAAILDWIDCAHAAQLLVAIAGRLDADGVARAAALGADIVGVRGAACDGGRRGRVAAARVRALVAAAHD